MYPNTYLSLPFVNTIILWEHGKLIFRVVWDYIVCESKSWRDGEVLFEFSILFKIDLTGNQQKEIFSFKCVLFKFFFISSKYTDFSKHIGNKNIYFQISKKVFIYFSVWVYVLWYYLFFLYVFSFKKILSIFFTLILIGNNIVSLKHSRSFFPDLMKSTFVQKFISALGCSWRKNNISRKVERK